MTDTIFITGASGQLGRLVIQHLLALGVAADRILAGTRSPEKLAALAEQGVKVRKADFEDGPGLVEAFAGADTVLIISTEILDAGGHRIQQHRTAIASAVAAGVKQLAYTSIPDPKDSPLNFAPDHVDTERAIRDTKLPYIIFQNGWYAENLLGALPPALASGQWYTSAAGGRTSYVGRDDIAASIAAALAKPPSGSATYKLTGQDAFSVDEVAKLVSDIMGKPLTVINVTDAQIAAGLKAAGLPEGLITVLVSAESAARSNSLALVTSDLEHLTGHPAKSLAAVLTENKALLAS